MGCQGSRAAPRAAEAHGDDRHFQLVTTDAFTSDARGRVQCVLPAHRLPAKRVTWTDQANGQVVQDGDLELRAPPGRYLVQIVDSAEEYTEMATTIGVLPCPVVTAYACEACSSSASRDGAVTATVARAPRGARYLWTSGVVTAEPTLRNAAVGVYTVAVLDASGAVVEFVHACDACRLSADPARLP